MCSLLFDVSNLPPTLVSFRGNSRGSVPLIEVLRIYIFRYEWSVRQGYAKGM